MKRLSLGKRVVTNGRGSTASEATIVPLLLSAKAAAALCGVSLRTWRSWDAAGKIPRAIRIGRSTRWREDQLRAWVAADCPGRDEWESRKPRG